MRACAHEKVQEEGQMVDGDLSRVPDSVGNTGGRAKAAFLMAVAEFE